MVIFVLMAALVAVNFLAMRIFARVNNVITWWKVAVPALAIIVLLGQFRGPTKREGRGLHAGRDQGPVRHAARRRHHLRLLRLRAGQPASRGDQEPAAQRAAGDHHLGSRRHRDLLPGAGRVHRRHRPASQIGQGVRQDITNTDILSVPVTSLASIASGSAAGWRSSCGSTGFVSAAGTGLIYTTGTSRISYGLARNRYFPQIFSELSSKRIPWVGLITGYVIGLFFLLPFPSWHSLVGADHRGQRADVRRRPAVPGRIPPPGSDAPRPYRMPAAAVLAPLAFIVADLLIYWSGFGGDLKIGSVLFVGYVTFGAFDGVRPDRPPLEWRSATWLPVWLIGLGTSPGRASTARPLGCPPGRRQRCNIQFWWDMLMVAAFSLIVYYWAMRPKLPREEMLTPVAGKTESS